MTITILGPQDFSGYAKNKPSSAWELVKYTWGEYSETWWTPKWLVNKELNEL